LQAGGHCRRATAAQNHGAAEREAEQYQRAGLGNLQRRVAKSEVVDLEVEGRRGEDDLVIEGGAEVEVDIPAGGEGLLIAARGKPGEIGNLGARVRRNRHVITEKSDRVPAIHRSPIEPKVI